MKKEQNIKIRPKGFTIIEIAIVITIVALVSATLLVFANGKMNEAGINITRQKMLMIEKAIQAYVKQYGNLPCPANITLATTDTYYGYGPTQASGCASSGSAQLNSSNVYAGLVPFKTLGPNLPAALTVDAWGNRIVYVMDQRYTSTATNGSGFGSSNSQALTNSSNTDIIMRVQASGGNVIEGNGSNNPNNSSKAAYILLSYGPNGFYGRADKNPGTINPSSGNGNEQENRFNDQTFVQRITDQNFDDIVRFKTRWQLE